MFSIAFVIATRLLIITGEDNHHDWRATTPVLEALLEQDPRLQVDVLDDLTRLKDIDLSAYAAVVVHFKNENPDVPGRAGFDNLDQYVRNGGGLVSVHFGCGAFEEFRSDYQQLMGRVWFGLPAPKGKRQHDPYGPFRVEPADSSHSITAGLSSFATEDELYTCLTGDAAIEVLAEAQSPVDGQWYPMALAHNPDGGRVFLCTLGHDVNAYSAAGVGELYRRGAAWAAGLPPVAVQEGVATDEATDHQLQAAFDPSRYDVIWDGGSNNDSASMPLGNGDIGVNVWSGQPSPGQDSALNFYLSKTDSWSENGRLLKVGQVRVRTEPPLGEVQQQWLDLKNGQYVATFGVGRDSAELRLWVDANHPVVHVTVDCYEPSVAIAEVILMRDKVEPYPEAEVSDLMEDRSKPNRLHKEVLIQQDSIILNSSEQIGWYHYNKASVGPEQIAEIQGLAGYLQKQHDPLLGRIFGGIISAQNGHGDTATARDDFELSSVGDNHHRFSVFVRTDHPSNPAEWKLGIHRDRREFEKVDFQRRSIQHQRWWQDFWARSWLHLSNNAAVEPEIWKVPDNDYEVRIGEDQHGANLFAGKIENPRWSTKAGLQLDAKITPDIQAPGGGRIFDKITPGGSDGFLFDTHPGNSLRLIVGERMIQAKDVLKKGKPVTVGARMDAKTGELKILLDGKVIANSQANMEQDFDVVARAYALQRWVDACAGRGRYPIKFNGSIFTTSHANKFGGADYRRWGPGYWWQNTRLPYLSMCASGDTEMMRPLFRMYAEELMPLHKFRTKQYTGHDGAFLPECMYFWGPTFTATYGWTPYREREDKLQQSPWHKWEWVSGLELVWMMLDYVEHTEDWEYFQQWVIPTAREVLTFFQQHSPLDENGKLVMTPSQALETWWDCTNPMPEVAGLHAVTDRLMSLDASLSTREDWSFWQEIKRITPPLPTWHKDGVELLAPAERFEQKSNVENPELYAVYPFRLVSFEKPTAELGLRALDNRWDRGASGWRQDDLFMTHLGLAQDAKKNLVSRANNKHQGSRFPVFWGPNYDWIPDQDHGGVLMRSLQTMLLQTEGRKIFLLPAWPREWNAEFQLHAPYNTTLSGRVVDGQIKDLVVTPPERRLDIVFPLDLK